MKTTGLSAFILAITASAALLFIVEPMAARMLLPRFGGSAAVWSVAIVFFQAALLLGYLYAHALTRWLAPRTAALVQIGVLAAGFATLPIAVGEGETSAYPALAVLLALAAAVGLPFTALAANAPLLQAWYARSALPGADNPYPLYAASNAGSLVALLAYPFVIEPLAALRTQAWGWTMGYAVLIGLIGAAVLLGRPVRWPSQKPSLERRGWLAWVGLALVPSAALVAVTAHISSDIAAAPLLWVVPLALYLVTFILAFGGNAERWSRLARGALPVVLVSVALLMGARIRLGVVADALLHLTAFFAIGLTFHSMLAARRPPAERLTSFYLAMSAGGLIGGIAAALVAPAIFSFVAEYPLVLVIAALAAPWRLAVAGLVAALLILPGLLWPSAQERITRRSFYGVHTMEVSADGRFRVLRHGQEIHGAMRLVNDDGSRPSGPPKPLTYYHENGSISEAIDAVKAKAGRPIRAGVVGLGTGSTACLVDAADRIDFYEIDPEIIRIAQDPKLFSFLDGCRANVSIIEGDARLTLQRAAKSYDILIIDAFSSDAIPTHLLTREAMATYMARLAPGGILLMHISNDRLRLNDIVAATARAENLAVRIFDEDEDTSAGPLIYQATVAAIARRDADFGDLARSDEWIASEAPIDVRPWTDDYSNLFAAILAKLRLG